MSSFVIRVIYEPTNEQLPWNVNIHHVQSGRIYRLNNLTEIGSLLEDLLKAENVAEKEKVIPLHPRRAPEREWEEP